MQNVSVCNKVNVNVGMIEIKEEACSVQCIENSFQSLILMRCLCHPVAIISRMLLECFPYTLVVLVKQFFNHLSQSNTNLSGF